MPSIILVFILDLLELSDGLLVAHKIFMIIDQNSFASQMGQLFESQRYFSKLMQVNDILDSRVNFADHLMPMMWLHLPPGFGNHKKYGFIWPVMLKESVYVINNRL